MAGKKAICREDGAGARIADAQAALAELIAAQRQEQESALAESDARANALEAALLIRVDAHELWHDAGDNDA